MTVVHLQAFKEKYTPIILVEIYLISTVILFSLGPIDFSIHNKILFWLLIVLYHLFFVFGYFIGIRQFSKKKMQDKLGNFRKINSGFCFFLGLSASGLHIKI